MKEFKETTKKSTITLIIIIAILSTLFILSLIGEISLEPKEKVPAPNKTEEKIYTYDEIAGLYTFIEEEKKDSEGLLESTNYYLYLYDDGTFNYRMSSDAPFGRIGNYIISGNKIKLNLMYGYNSGVGLSYVGEKHELIINSDSTITDNENVSTKKQVSLTKSNDETMINNFKEQTLNQLIKNDYEINQAMIKNK